MSDVKICQTAELTLWCRDQFGMDGQFRSAENVKNVVEDVFGQAGIDLSVEVSSNSPETPGQIQTIDGNEWNNYEYDHLRDWFENFLEDGSYPFGHWSNLLLSAGDDTSGVRGRGVVGTPPWSNQPLTAVSRMGKGAANFLWSISGNSRFHDDGSAYRDVQTAVHEIGHNILPYVELGFVNPDDNCADDEAAHHRKGNVHHYRTTGGSTWSSESDEYAVTPMSGSTSYHECMMFNQNNSNFCAHTVEASTGEITASDLRYSDCTVEYIEQNFE